MGFCKSLSYLPYFLRPPARQPRMSTLKDECGIAAAVHLGGEPVASHAIPHMLLDIQNRGQLAAGLTSYLHGRDQIIDTHRDVGTVNEVFKLSREVEAQELMHRYRGTAAIGHVRYATCGLNDPSYAQPFERHHGRCWKWFSFGFNGNLANFVQLKAQLMNKANYHITRDTDTEVIMHNLSYELRGNRQPSLVNVFKKLSRRFDGAYSLAFINAMGEVAVVRYPLGVKPLAYAQTKEWFMAASESVAIANQGIADVQSLPPGTLAYVKDGEVRIERFAECKRTAHCFFEWVYFANAASTLEGKSVYLARTNLGKELARLEHVDPYGAIVVPVPDTAKAAGSAMAFELGVPALEGLLRNRYVGRTFIEPSHRHIKAQRKYTPVREVLEGKRIFLVEDSLVRCNTLRAIIGHMRNRGKAKEIHVRITCPPIMAPCCYGIDMASIAELYAPQFAERVYDGMLPKKITDRMAKDVGADTLMYMPVESIPRCIGLPREALCMACITGKYPTPCGRSMYRVARQMFHEGKEGRAYESNKPPAKPKKKKKQPTR